MSVVYFETLRVVLERKGTRETLAEPLTTSAGEEPNSTATNVVCLVLKCDWC